MSKFLLGYWGVQGAAQPTRFLFAYLNIPFEQKSYSDPNEWFGKDKPNFKGAFPNLPYLIHGDVFLTESKAIPFYVGLQTKNGHMFGNNDQEKVQTEMLKGVMDDTFTPIGKYVFGEKDKTKDSWKKTVDENVVPKLKMFEKYLGNKKFFFGDKPQFIDLRFGYQLQVFFQFCPSLKATFPSLDAFSTNVRNLPGITQFLQSDQCPKFFYGPDNDNAMLKVAY